MKMSFDEMINRIKGQKPENAEDVIGCLLAIHEFLNEWQNDPWKWYQEIDVQAELARRIHDKLGTQSIWAYHDHHHHGKKKVMFSRVACEPYGKEKRDSSCRPDIVAWNPSPQDVELNSGNYPTTIIVEVKLKTYMSEMEGENDDSAKVAKHLSSNWYNVGCVLKLLGYPPEYYKTKQDCPITEEWEMRSDSQKPLLVCSLQPRQWSSGKSSN